ncbi:MAG: FKBP-type peptidyl-prolyl cis-trans isomerase [Clostridiales bacterium]|nr:MAG: FKBP-type peptidyl-prolyl cis-trans isomerase [Clostridiales bacterium]
MKLPTIRFRRNSCSHRTKRLASLKSKKRQKKPKKGDICNIDFEGSVGGVKFDGGAGKDYDLNLAAKPLSPVFEEGVVGMKKGETKDITVTFPEEYSEKPCRKRSGFQSNAQRH